MHSSSCSRLLRYLPPTEKCARRSLAEQVAVPSLATTMPAAADANSPALGPSVPAANANASVLTNVSPAPTAHE